MLIIIEVICILSYSGYMLAELIDLLLDFVDGRKIKFRTILGQVFSVIVLLNIVLFFNIFL